MGQLVASAIDGRLAEDDIVGVHLQVFRQLLYTYEPHEVDNSRAVGEVGYDSLLARSLLKLLEAEDVSLQLDVGHLARQLADGVDAAAVDVFVGIILQQVAERTDVQLPLQDFFPMRSDPRYIFDILFKNVQHQCSFL